MDRHEGQKYVSSYQYSTTADTWNLVCVLPFVRTASTSPYWSWTTHPVTTVWPLPAELQMKMPESM